MVSNNLLTQKKTSRPVDASKSEIHGEGKRLVSIYINIPF